MKDIDESNRALFGTPNTDHSLDKIRAALHFLWNEKRKAGLDCVAGAFTYEELIQTLLHAEASELERQAMEHDYDELVRLTNARAEASVQQL